MKMIEYKRGDVVSADSNIIKIVKKISPNLFEVRIWGISNYEPNWSYRTYQFTRSRLGKIFTKSEKNKYGM
jgi:hypothetical protein